LIVTFHGYDATQTDAAFRRDRRGRRFLQCRDRLKREAAAFIAVSEYIGERLVQQGFPQDKIYVHHIGVDVGKFHPNPDIDRENIVLFVGRLVSKKGCEYLIRAMEGIQARTSATEVIIIGDGPLRAALETQAKTSLRRFRFLGAQPSRVICEWMKRAKVLCTPSVVDDSGDAEGFGIVFIEAQLCGLPVVSFSSGGVPEAVAHGETGYLAPEKDWRTLSRYIAALLDDQVLWSKFSYAGRERGKRLFDLARQTNKLEEIYNRVVSE
jgi:glycosyltransferase involved in cell wall biosynthesis